MPRLAHLLLVVIPSLAAPAAAQAVPDPYHRLPVVDGVVPGEPGLVVVQTPSPDVCGGVRVTVRPVKARGGPRPADAATYALLATAFPANLDFSPDHRAHREASLRRFNTFVETLRKQASAIIERVNDATLAPDARAAAFARAVQVRRRMIEILLRAEIPVDVRTGAFAKEKTEAYCAKMAEVSEPMLATLEDGVLACHAAGEHAGAGWWTSVC